MTTGVGLLSIDGPIATESSRVIAGGVDEDGSATAVVEADAAAALLDADKGSFVDSAVDIAGCDASAGLVFSLAISDVLVVPGKSDVMGEVEGIENVIEEALRTCALSLRSVEVAHLDWNSCLWWLNLAGWCHAQGLPIALTMPLVGPLGGCDGIQVYGRTGDSSGATPIDAGQGY